jgi:hypothetical protein
MRSASAFEQIADLVVEPQPAAAAAEEKCGENYDEDKKDKAWDPA